MFNKDFLSLLKKSAFVLFICAGLVSLFSCSNLKIDDSADEIRNEKYTDFIQQAEVYLLENNFHGSVLIGKKNQVIYAAGFGSSDSKNINAANNTIHTVYEIGSVTKQMTAAAVMQLVEVQKLAVDCKISEFFPNYSHGDEITVEMLLNMRSGLTDYINSADEFFPRKICNQIERNQISNKPVDENIVLKYFYDAPLLAKPDSTYFYCNTNYYLLACIVEKVSGMTFNDYMQQNIFAPCNMYSANLNFQNTSSKGYDYKGRYYSIPQALSKGCGDVNASVLDVFKWNCNFYQSKIVSRKSFKQMTASQSYGYGVYCSKDAFFHAGNTNVFNSYNAYYPKDGLSVIVLANEPVSKSSTTITGRNLYKIYKNSNK